MVGVEQDSLVVHRKQVEKLGTPLERVAGNILLEVEVHTHQYGRGGDGVHSGVCYSVLPFQE